MNPLILIIEEDERLRSHLVYLLELENFNCLMTENGLTGFKLAQEFQPDLIIFDINMTKLDDYTFMNQLRGDFILAKIPLILLLSQADFDNPYHNWRLRANDYLAKPITLSQLLTAIHKHLPVVSWA